jgi:lipopolysaccharide export system permease protein
MSAELNNRLVNIVGMLILPILALPFAIGRRRHMRAYRFGVAVAVLIGFHEVVEQGGLLTENTGLTPLLTIWAPFALLVIFALWRFWNVCFRVRIDRMDPLFDRMALISQAIRRRLLPQAEGRS